MPARAGRTVARLPTARAEDLPNRHDRDSAELQTARAQEVPGRHDRHAAQLQASSCGEVPERHDGTAAELQDAPVEAAADAQRLQPDAFSAWPSLSSHRRISKRKGEAMPPLTDSASCVWTSLAVALGSLALCAESLAVIAFCTR